MKRSPIQRKTPLRAKGKSRFPKRRSPEFLTWLSTLPCILLTKGERCGVVWVELKDGRWRRSDPAHLKTRGAGGDDVGNCVPLCRKHHNEQEGRTEEFEAKYNVSLTAEAQRLAQQWSNER